MVNKDSGEPGSYVPRIIINLRITDGYIYIYPAADLLFLNNSSLISIVVLKLDTRCFRYSCVCHALSKLFFADTHFLTADPLVGYAVIIVPSEPTTTFMLLIPLFG